MSVIKSDASTVDAIIRNTHATGLARLIVQSNTDAQNAQLVADDNNGYAWVGSSTGGTNRVVFKQNKDAYYEGGNFGIGDDNPAYRLSITGSNDERVQINNTSNKTAGLFMRVLSSGTQVGTGTIATQNDGSMKFFTGTSSEGERMRITSGGIVQIQNQLKFRGISSSQTANIITDETDTGTGILRIQAGGGSAAYGGGLALYANAAGTKAGDVAVGLSAVAGAVFRVNLTGTDTSTDVLTMTRSGNMTITGTLTQNSDIRIKENIKPLESQLEIIGKLNPVSYNKKENKETLEPYKEKKEIGFIAQEVEEILPELISENKEGIKSLAYGNMNAVLVKAIQELSAKVERLEKECKCK